MQGCPQKWGVKPIFIWLIGLGTSVENDVLTCGHDILDMNYETAKLWFQNNTFDYLMRELRN